MTPIVGEALLAPSMCGIAGWVGAGAADRKIGERMARRLRHRGPDGWGVELLANGRGVFAHTRLAIIDLTERARQPFVSEDGRVALTFNGEIYEFAVLRAALEARGYSFRSDSDTEVVLAQYLEHGLDGLDALDGMFALAIYDGRDDTLILARDRAGKKPLYWTRTDGGLAFASEVKALAECPAVTLRPDVDALPQLLAYGYAPTPTSMFAGVFKLPPASRLVLARGELSVHRYWSLDTAAAETTPMSIEDAKRAIRSAIGDAVERRLISDVPLGAFLSGGIDSSIVVAEMAARSSGPVRTFAVGFDDDKTYDERGYARRVAERFGADHTELTVSSSPEGLLELLLDHHDEPYGDSSALAVYAVAKATREHVTVALTGDGGDEVFAGYTRFLGGLMAGVVPGALARGAYSALSTLPEPRGYKHPVTLARRFLEHGTRSADEQLLAWNSFFSGSQLTDILAPDVRGPRFDPWSVYRGQLEIFEHEREAGRERLDQILRHNFATYLLDDLLVKTDRMTMAASLEARSPFLDTALVELAFRIPGALKMRRGQLKWLLREAYRDVLPTEVLDRKKHGFGVPMASWWSGALAPLVDDVLLGPPAHAYPWLDRRAIRRVVEEHRSGARDHAQRIFLLLQIELWLRTFSR